MGCDRERTIDNWERQGWPKSILSQLSNATCLDMKWENHDINVEQWANIPNFSALTI